MVNRYSMDTNYIRIIQENPCGMNKDCADIIQKQSFT